MRGGSAKSRRMHGGGVLARSSCARLARVIRLGCFYCGLRLGGFDYETRRRGKKKKYSIEYFSLDGLWRNRYNPLVKTSAVADTIGCTTGCVAVVDRNENVAGCDHADVTLIQNIGVTTSFNIDIIFKLGIGRAQARRKRITTSRVLDAA